MRREVSPRRPGVRGFTLVEVLVVLLILAVLMSLALPAYLGALTDSQRRACRANMQTIASAEQAYLLRGSAHLYVLISGGPPGDYIFLTTDGAPVSDFVGRGDLARMPVCPTGHAYGVQVESGLLLISCSDPLHGIFRPGRDSE